MLPAGVIAQGLVQGSLAGFNSLGLVLLWRTSRVVNLAQPAMGLVAGVLTGMLVASAGWSFWWAAPVGLALGGVLGFLAERVVLVRLQDVPRVVLLVATVGLAQVFAALQAALPFAFGGRLPTYTVDLGFSLYVAPQNLLGPHLLTLITFPLALGGLWWFLHRSRTGLAACALGQDAERARALGVPAAVVRSVVWTVAGLVASLSGILSVPVLGFSLDAGTGPTVLLLALAPAVLAGLKSLPGAAASALALGVAYQAALWYSPRAGIADLLLAAAVLAAVATGRRRLGRGAAAARASSWEAATTPRPMPWAVSRSGRFRAAVAIFVPVSVAAAALPPVLLSPSRDVLYATSTSLALAALAVGAAWMFAGEIPLGHWGLAGLGATVAAVTPGPWPLKFAAAGAALGATGAVLAAASRRQSNLSFAVLGLAAAAAAPVAVLALGQRSVPTDPGVVGAIGGAFAVAAAFGLSWLRASAAGLRMVAARDDPRRAPWLGADAARGRVVALALSAALAGCAGTLYLAATPAGLAPGAFDPARSLDVLAMAVVGGLGSPLGVLLGAGGLQAARLGLPGPWSMLASGTGVLLVVVFVPGGLSRIVAAARERVVRAIAGVDVVPVQTQDPAGTPPVSARPARFVDRSGARFAGSDSREAAATPTVRSAALAAALSAALGWAAALGLPTAARPVFRVPSGAATWTSLVASALGLAWAFVAWRLAPVLLARPRNARRALPPGVTAAGGVALAAIYVAVTGDEEVALLAVVATIVLAGWMVGQAARIAAAACARGVAQAAQGIVVSAAILGAIPAGHLGLVAAGSGLRRVASWGAVYAAASGLCFVRASRTIAADRRRLRATIEYPGAATAGPDPPALLVDRVSVTFGSTPVLVSATLEARSGELLALVGGNGTGKSTLLRVAAGLAMPDGGRVAIRGEDVTMLRPEERAAAGLAFVSGARPVFPDMSVLDNLRVAAYRTHPSASAFAAATDAILGFVPALAHRGSANVGVLSGGEQRLLAVAQSLYRRPVALLADELTLGLDPQARHSVLDLLRMLADDGVAVVVVDHDLPALLPRADRAALVVGGTVEAYDDPAELLARRADLLPATFLAGVG